MPRDMDKLYPLVTPYRTDARFDPLSSKFLGWKWVKKLRARKTGEFRAPKEGEWFLSGATPQAYLALHNLSHEFYIVEIVRVATITYEYVVEVLP